MEPNDPQFLAMRSDINQIRNKIVEQVLMETLRLWPTAPGFAVHPIENTTLAGRYRLTPDDILLILLPVLHRDSKVWDEPDVFRPARFNFDHAKDVLQHAWKPLGNGQRACLGRGFAMQEAVLVMAMISVYTSHCSTIAMSSLSARH
ncbi:MULTISPECIES: cytochrome P450 [Sinorhizobium]|uniref:Cytochrome P450 n=1 Tax=Sinorhizobium americanum TaxID=194963 RepID=A0A2S3YQL4_9HYPH|nr:MULTISPECIES: cytochrome P450 [Sinorhizobium]PDT34716.1 hypothetical protein CO656_27150 [Sinorhizobium sp. FG01]PDT49513.1 hypothetical protein CO664_27615 [Sinorhizobium sp. NG07B]POH33349.1 hypothetical protein ATY30_02740 [Sinorhizobium americanum]POH33523.1 hypothetical protein ATY31_10525 [Sinorhizobium americanum]